VLEHRIGHFVRDCCQAIADSVAITKSGGVVAYSRIGQKPLHGVYGYPIPSLDGVYVARSWRGGDYFIVRLHLYLPIAKACLFDLYCQ
jgi:hypothetical protein